MSETRYSTWHDYYLIIQGFFYGSQGVAYGIALFFARYLRSVGVSESQALTFQAVLLIPWYIKFLFGVLSDNVAIRNYGRRKPYVLIAALIGLVGWITLPLYSEFSVLLLISGIFASTGIALSDASIDALAVDITPPDRRGSMQGVSWGFRALGFGLSTFFGGSLIDQGQWSTLFIIPGILSTLSCLLVLLFKEIPLPSDFKNIPKKVYNTVFSSRPIQLTLVFEIFSGAAIAIIFLLETFLNGETNYTAESIGRILFFFALGMFTGALMIGSLGDKLPLRKTMIGSTILYIFVILSIFAFDLESFGQAAVYFALIGFINGGYEATQMRISMDYSPAIVGGTMFNLYNSISNIGQIAIGPILVYVIIQYIPTKLAWQTFSVFLIFALIITLHLLKTYPTSEVVQIGTDTSKSSDSKILQSQTK